MNQSRWTRESCLENLGRTLPPDEPNLTPDPENSRQARASSQSRYCSSGWHSDIVKTHAMQAEITDLKQRGMLEHTLVVWCTEFGRMPFLQANETGRDHNPDAFTCFLVGAGVKEGFSYGESDEFGFKATFNETSVSNFNATLLHLMGLDHERLTYYYNGIKRRLTNVHGHVVKGVLA